LPVRADTTCRETQCSRDVVVKSTAGLPDMETGTGGEEMGEGKGRE
jgi:hypothetical protein